jgi:mevalonate kinase
LKKQRFYSNGKLLITGEYLVLHGALALAIPTIPGQKMHVDHAGVSGQLIWKSLYKHDPWFMAMFSLPDFEIIRSSNPNSATYLQQLLLEAHRINPKILKKNKSPHVKTILGFDPDWGLGSSSSLISNVASWFSIDVYELFFNTQKGSGYDIACAGAQHPVFYQLIKASPKTEKANFDPPFKSSLAFVYSGRKQDSEASVNHFLSSTGFREHDKNRISEISREIVKTNTLKGFNALLDEHEEIMSEVLQLPKIKEQSFPDFPGSIKSLGAWGGDFLLASSEIEYEEIKSYFSNKGLDIIFSWEELILNFEF